MSGLNSTKLVILNLNKKEYLRQSWVDERLKVGPSLIAGQGIFTTRDIKEGEILMIWGGIEIPRAEYNDDDFHPRSTVRISEDTYLGRPISDSEESPDDYLNHSCDPNAWLTDEVTVVARRDIKAGEEITVDCATWDSDEEWAYFDEGEGPCRCGSALCRKNLTPQDWRRPELQERYVGHFSPYITRKIRQNG